MTVRAGREFSGHPRTHHHARRSAAGDASPALDIYSDQMVELTESLLRDLAKLFATKGRSYIYIASNCGAWEATLSNVLSRGDKVLVLESGQVRDRVGPRRGDGRRGRGAERATGAAQSAPIEARLRRDKDHTIKAVLASAGRYRVRRL